MLKLLSKVLYKEMMLFPHICSISYRAKDFNEIKNE